MTTRQELPEALRRVLGADAVVTDPDVVGGYRSDQAALVEAGWPTAVVFPRTTGEVAATVEACAAADVPIVPRGAGSGLAGGANAIDGCIVLSLTRMDEILRVDPARQTATVQPGVVNADLAAAAAAHGLWYPPDPASWEESTIGGNVATNAGGLCCVKYGVTRDAVLALEVVLADGAVCRVGRQSVKGVAGYDLVGLFVGSEGTLGIVTEITVRLRPARTAPTTLVASFPRLVQAGAAVEAICQRSTPALLEILDATTIAAIERWKRMDLDTEAAALLLAQTDLPGAPGHEEVAAMAAACEAAGADLVVRSEAPADADALLAARRFAFPALERLGSTLLDDVAVPRDRLTDLIDEIARIAAHHGLLIGTFGHAGDGNLHPTIVFDDRDPDAAAAARAAFDDVVDAALRLGGTVTGEHGVGLLKRAHLRDELGPVGMRLQRAVKDAFDPRGILNPGKVLWPRGHGAP
jgi:glycolate oxidase